MKRLALLALLASTSCFASVMFPVGGDGNIYHVDQMGAPVAYKKKKVIKPDTDSSGKISLDTMVHSPKDIVPDQWPTK